MHRGSTLVIVILGEVIAKRYMLDSILQCEMRVGPYLITHKIYGEKKRNLPNLKRTWKVQALQYLPSERTIFLWTTRVYLTVTVTCHRVPNRGRKGSSKL